MPIRKDIFRDDIISTISTHYEWTHEQRKIFAFPFIINMANPVLMIITGSHIFLAQMMY